ncbi:MAG: cellulase family glycosylhydrolase, partial [Thermogutta sp.]|nr:cellulase family glycosylhydrolase [Thermogutta sp.]
MEAIRLSPDGRDFVRERTGRRFVAWGFNYDHDAAGRLIEDYWLDEWDRVVQDFREMKALGANTVRIHFQVARFVKSPEEIDPAALAQLKRLVHMAEDMRLYLDITGLGCYHKSDVPPWYDALSEQDRWAVQARFWEAVAEACHDSPAVFCYDLMNEPILPGEGRPETEWLAGEFGGKHFVQRLTLDLAGRTRIEVAAAWVARMVMAIRRHDPHRLITVGVIPWALVFPGAKPIFYSPEAGKHLDFVSVHFYPETGKVEDALRALAVYDVGKPVVVEEMFPLKCTLDELDAFVEGSRPLADGWIGFYWGETVPELTERSGDLTAAIVRHWLEYFAGKG